MQLWWIVWQLLQIHNDEETAKAAEAPIPVAMPMSNGSREEAQDGHLLLDAWLACTK